ncbi:probable WRKY transcription factor 75 [Abrus precatorius]|uniref:Probable WRKY transcription factor 75 n=1 Tax=Abrus precatorius TaxID=3816 RepID=A0A8B8LU80_ABRPR|nr:probable WRKY transcription factor 75 [Abrus precatorius]
MEKHQVEFPTSSSTSLAAYNSNMVHVEKEEVLRTQGKAISAQKEGDKQEIKQHRYAFQTRSPVDVLDDGYQWRKYGKKIVKSNKFPRSYYRCSHRGCNVKKQIQRHSQDEEIVVTTYEGMHTHPVDKSTESFDQILGNLFLNNLLCSNVPPTLE